MRRAALFGGATLGLALLGSSPAHAAPGAWVNVSAIPSGSSYPEISTSAVPAIGTFGNDVQIAWSRSDGTASNGVYTAILDKGGSVKTGSTSVVNGWLTMSRYPQLLSYQGQRAVSFGGQQQSGVSRGQNLATSGDGIGWSVNPGSLSATNLADTSSGGGTVNSAGETLIWAGAPNLGSFVWHVGLAPTNPAPDGTDQVFRPSSSGTSGVNVAYSAGVNATYGAFYLRASNPAEAGTFIAQIHPTFSGFSQVPGSFIVDSSGNAQSTEAGNIVPLAARSQGGVYVAYIDRAAGDTIKVREIGSGAVLAVPASAGAEQVSLSAAGNGRLWIAFEKSGQLYAAQTDPGARAFGVPAGWGNAERGASIYAATIKGDDAGAYVGINVFAAGEQNIYATSVIPNLTISVVGQARRGGTVKIRVLDGGAPVRNARVTVGGKALKTKAGGIVTFTAPRAGSVKVVAKGSGYRDGANTIVLR